MHGLEHSQAPRQWAEAQFAGADLSDVRRIARVTMIAEALATSPGASLPQMFARRYDLKAMYELLKHPEATPDQLQAGHREGVLWEMQKPGTYLLLEDTSEIVCAKQQEIEGLGPVGGSKKKKMGFLLHSVLCVRWSGETDTEAPKRPPVEVLGVADQQFDVRRPRRSRRDYGSARRMMAGGQLESGVWEKASQRIGPAPASKEVTWIKVCDRGADIYDHIRECEGQGQRYVIRAKSNRAVLAAAGEPVGKLFEAARSSPSLCQLELALRTRPKKPARVAKLAVSVTPVIVRSPSALGQAPGSRPPIFCSAVRVWEPNPPAGITPLEWILLTDLAAEEFAAARVAQIYATRWLEEEFHKALKTGMNLEQLQLTTAHAWFAITAIMSVVALRLIALRETVRQAPNAAASATNVSELELQVLSARIGKPLPTAKSVALALGRLGGHLNRKADGLPGWITLWRGWRVLQTLVEGVLLARKLSQFG